LVDGSGWRGVFFINVPIGIALLVMAGPLLDNDGPRVRQRRFDVAGATTATSGLVVLVYALNRGASHGWGSIETVVLFAVEVTFLVQFVRVEARAGEPPVPRSVVRNRSLLSANSLVFFAFGGFFSFIFVGSLLMQQVLG
jgi:hypothetical protein